MIKYFVNKYISPLLKENGFKKKNFTWNNSKIGVVQVINLQNSRFSNKEEFFTINIGILYPNIWEKCWGKELPKFIKEEDCFPRIRVGHLLSNKSDKLNDYWWECSNKINMVELGEEIKEVIEDKILLFLENMSNIRETVNFFSYENSNLMPIEKIYLAIIKYTLGDIDYSNKLLSEVISISESWANRVYKVRSQLILDYNSTC